MARKSQLREVGYIFSIPFVVTFLIFSLYPTLYTVVIGFTDLRGLGKTTFKILSIPLPITNRSRQRDVQAVVGQHHHHLGDELHPPDHATLLLTAWFTTRRFKVKAQGMFRCLSTCPTSSPPPSPSSSTPSSVTPRDRSMMLIRLGILEVPSISTCRSGPPRA